LKQPYREGQADLTYHSCLFYLIMGLLILALVVFLFWLNAR